MQSDFISCILRSMTSFTVAGTAAEAVALLCKNRDVTQHDLAKFLGITPSAVSQKILGKSTFTLSQIHRIADYFDVSVDALLGREPLEVS